METVDRIEQTSRGFSVVLIAMLGAQTLCEDMEPLLGPWGTLAALIAVGVCWHAPIVRGCLRRQPKVFAAIAAVGVAVMTVAFSLSPHAQVFPFCHP